jgi:predicted Rossmann-fold nucleotide-binding protein
MPFNTLSIDAAAWFNPETEQWEYFGDTGFSVVHTTSGNKLSAKVTLREKVNTEKYFVQVNSLTTSADARLEAYSSDINETGFVVTISGATLKQRIGFSFQVRGVKQQVVPDDREIPKDGRISDIHSIDQLLAFKAEYGVVTVMGSASISLTPKLKSMKESYAAQLSQLEVEAEREPSLKAFYDIRAVHSTARIKRLELLEGVSQYAESAYKFGRKWGQYCATTQEAELDGRHVPICTGGGPGIMAAVAQGASEEFAEVVGIDAVFGNDQFFKIKDTHASLSNVRLVCNDFSIREGALINYSHVVLFWPGGFGTGWEVFETLSKISTSHIRRSRTKAIFVHPEFWQPLFDFVDHLRVMGTINKTTDWIKPAGASGCDQDDSCVAYIAKDEDEAFDMTKAHIQYLHRNNRLSIR